MTLTIPEADTASGQLVMATASTMTPPLVQ